MKYVLAMFISLMALWSVIYLATKAKPSDNFEQFTLGEMLGLTISIVSIGTWAICLIALSAKLLAWIF